MGVSRRGVNLSSKLPYLASPGLVQKILSKIQEAKRPERFTQDFLETKLGFSGGSSRPIIPLLKRMNFLSTDGVPTRLYDQFRNPTGQGHAMSIGIRNAYSDLFERNEYAHDLQKEKLTGLVSEITGASFDDSTTRCIVSTFNSLKQFADFDSEPARTGSDHEREVAPAGVPEERKLSSAAYSDEVNFAVSYTINLNLPETTNPDVFNAIFRALRENLLTRQ